MHLVRLLPPGNTLAADSRAAVDALVGRAGRQGAPSASLHGARSALLFAASARALFARLQVPTRMSDVQRPSSLPVWRFISSARSLAGCGRCTTFSESTSLSTISEQFTTSDSIRSTCPLEAHPWQLYRKENNTIFRRHSRGKT